MDFARLKEILGKLGENDVDVLKLYILQVGCLAFAPKKLPDHGSSRPVSELEEMQDASDEADPSSTKFAEGALAEVFEALKSHPNIFDLSPEKTPELLSTTLGDYKIIGSKLFHFKINLPERLQHFRSMFAENTANIEQIEVTTNGSLFASYAQVDEFPQRIWAGQEYRELLIEIITKRAKIHGIPVPPCPIHPVIYVAFLPKTYEPKKYFYCVRGDLFF